ncbi:MAG: hypothetical protein AAF570_00600, partial [Bacteroidota bacterium]
MKIVFTFSMLLLCAFDLSAQQLPEWYRERLFEEKVRSGELKSILTEFISSETRPESHHTNKTATTTETQLSSNTNANGDEGEAYLAINPADSTNLVVSYMDFSGMNLRFP